MSESVPALKPQRVDSRKEIPAAGLIGLGRMGLGVAQRLLEKGYSVVAHDVQDENLRLAEALGAQAVKTLAELTRALPKPRLIWLMVPAGEPVDQVLFGEDRTEKTGLVLHLEPGDVVIDGGNSFYLDSMRRANQLKERGIEFLDCGSSGGLEGARVGLSLMVGGSKEAFERAHGLLSDLACPGGLAYLGSSGAGHFTKMVHNAIEYGMLEAIGEGFELLSASPFQLDLAQVARVWNHGSVIRGWLMELTERALQKDPQLESIKGDIGGGDTGNWAIAEAWKRGVPFPAIALAYAMRLRSRQEETFAGKVIAALRQEFGGHPPVPAKRDG